MSNHPDEISNYVSTLLTNGYVVLPKKLNEALLQSISTDLAGHFETAAFCTGAFYGTETKRFGRALIRSPLVAQLALDRTILSILDQVLGPNCDSLQLNLTQGIEICPGAPAQGPHRDHDMWAARKGDFELMVNVMWALDDFTKSNGATRIWPGSNQNLNEPFLPESDAIVAEMPAGSACLFLGSTLHSGGANYSAKSRRGLVISYCLGWLKPSENQWLAYPPEVARNFSPELAALVGYRQQAPNLGHFEGQCPSLLLKGTQVDAAFVDRLQADQTKLVDQYREMQFGFSAAA